MMHVRRMLSTVVENRSVDYDLEKGESGEDRTCLTEGALL